MAIFLSGLQNKILFDLEEEWKTLITVSESGVEQRRAKWDHPKRHVHISAKYLHGADGDTLWDFYHARKGAYEAFSWFVPYSDTYTRELVAVGDGTTQVFDIPGNNTSARTPYVDGVDWSAFVDQYGSGTGADGTDRIDFSQTPAAGQIIEMTFTGNLRLWCRFAVDKLSRPIFAEMAREWGVDLVEVKVAS